MKNLIIIALVLIGCARSEQSQVSKFDFINYSNMEWWPTFETMVLPYIDGLVIVSVEDTKEGYTVKYKGESITGEYFMPCLGYESGVKLQKDSTLFVSDTIFRDIVNHGVTRIKRDFIRGDTARITVISFLKAY